MTDKVQKIRAFLVGIADADGVSTILARAIEKKILPYIDSLQEEPVSEDLEKAIDTYLATYFGGEKEKQEWPFLKKMAIHFAMWQKGQDKKRLANNHKQIFNNGYEDGFEAGRDDVFDELEKEHASEDVENASIKYAQDKYMPVQTSQAFKAGAQWQKQQMMKGHLDFTIMKAQYCNEHIPPLKDLAQLPLIRFSPAKLLERGLKVGDKVKVIIIKEE